MNRSPILNMNMNISPAVYEFFFKKSLLFICNNFDFIACGTLCLYLFQLIFITCVFVTYRDITLNTLDSKQGKSW